MSVEWLFADIANYFKFIDLKKSKNWTQPTKCSHMFIFKYYIFVLWIKSTNISRIFSVKFVFNVNKIFIYTVYTMKLP